ncbi:MAG: helix-hairpin-helix domain-containing protein, partial [Dethiobacteria bacterium]|nr:helix-hairpin-helix domain-containing protein [Dethiobacteria bacterium]
MRCGDGKAVTIVGSFPPLQLGESLLVKGEWQVHDRFGKQLAVDQWERLVPATVEGLKGYLGCGLIKGIGPVTAARIVDSFGLETLEVMEKEPDRLQEVEGIGAVKAAGIVQSFRRYKEVQNVLVFLQGYGIGVGQAMRLYRRYGSDTINKVRENPYRLAEDVIGIGFKSADKIALKLGLPVDAPERVQASITYTLNRAAEQGHVYLPADLLFERIRELLELADGSLSLEFLQEQLQLMLTDERLYAEKLEGEEAVYAAPYYRAEGGSARLLLNLARLAKPFARLETEQAIARVKHDNDHLT